MITNINKVFTILVKLTLNWITNESLNFVQ